MLQITRDEYNRLANEHNASNKVAYADRDDDICFIVDGICCLAQSPIQEDLKGIYNINVFSLGSRSVNNIRVALQCVIESKKLGVEKIFITKKWHSFRRIFSDFILEENERYTIYELTDDAIKELEKYAKPKSD